MTDLPQAHDDRPGAAADRDGTASAALRVELLGGFRLVVDGRPAARLPSPRQQQLIALLLLQTRDGPVPRQRLAGTLWPESSDAQALTNLRRELHHLREAMPALDALIDTGTRTLAWCGTTANADVLAFETAAREGLAGKRHALIKAAGLYRGDLLPDCHGEWIEADRERVRSQAAGVLGELVSRLERECDFAAAAAHARQLTSLDPFDEPAWCALMRCHARRGDRATALHLYQECAAMLKRELGVQPGEALRLTYREVLESDSADASPETPARATAWPLVGREAEWQLLLRAWQTAAGGRPQLVVIRGEAGIGKTRLAEELVAWCRLHDVASVTTRCYAGEGRLAYAPIAAWLKSDVLAPTLATLDPSVASDVARLQPQLLTSRPDVPPPEPELESWQRLHFFESVAQVFRAAAPVLLVLDDLQWADADTLEWLQFVLRSAGGSPMLVVASLRVEEEEDNPPLSRLLAQLQRDRQLTAIMLAPLDRAATAMLANAIAGETLDEGAQARTFAETEGHPLFIVELGQMNGDTAHERGGEAGRSAVHAVVAARLALLSDDGRAAAEIAAAVGRDFRFDILAEASDLEEPALARALDELWARRIVRVHEDESWDFSHDRIREVAYRGIGPARRRLIHRRIARALELLEAPRLDQVSASIAMHLARGGHPARAIPYFERAAAVASRISANEEALRCLTQALTLLAQTPAGRERDRHELALRARLSVALNSTRGYAAPEVEANLARIFELAGDDDERVPVRWLWVAFTLRFMLGDLRSARAVAEQAVSGSLVDPTYLCEAHHAMGGLLVTVGEHAAACRHFDTALAVCDEQLRLTALGSDLRVFALSWSSHALWLAGDEAAALRRADEGVARARAHGHMYSLALASAYAALLHQMRGDRQRVVEFATLAIDLCQRFGFAYYGDWCLVLLGWADDKDAPHEGIAAIEAALGRLDTKRAQARRPYYLSLLAELCARIGDHTRAAAILTAATAMAEARGEAWWLPALYLQISGLEVGSAAAATRERALGLARGQGSVSLERRILAAISAAAPV